MSLNYTLTIKNNGGSAYAYTHRSRFKFQLPAFTEKAVSVPQTVYPLMVLDIAKYSHISIEDTVEPTTIDVNNVNVTSIGGTEVTGPNDLKADVSGLSTFDPATDEVDIGKVKGVAVTDITDFHNPA